jgi:hypothetical protein
MTLEMPNERMASITTLLTDSAAARTPKTVLAPVNLQEQPAKRRLAAYTLAQGRRGGRKTDFTGCFRLGGLFVEQSEPPASGVVVVVDDMNRVDMPALWRELSEGMNWGKDAIHQALLTDGREWVALTRTRDDRFDPRERFISPRDMKSRLGMGGGESGDSDAAIFREKLRRALLPWREIDNPAILASLLGSYLRSQALSAINNAAWSDSRNGLVRLLKKELGVELSNSDRDETVSRIFAAIVLLRRICDALPRIPAIPLAISEPGNLISLCGKSAFREDGVLAAPEDIVAASLAGDPSPTRLAEFCQALWTEIHGDAHAYALAAPLPADIADTHIEFLKQRLQTDVPLFRGFDDQKIAWFDLHAGTGNLFIRALYGGAHGPGVKGEAAAIEADPLKFHLLRLRVMAAMLDMSGKGEPLPSMRLSLANPLGTPEARNRIPDAPLTILGSDLRVFKEKHASVTGNPALAGRYKTQLRDVWSMWTLDEQDRFIQYAALADDFVGQRPHAVALLFTPRLWLDADALAPVRMSWGRNADKMFVTVLPCGGADAPIRKAGLVSALLLRLAGGRSLDARGQEIRYAEDVPAAMLADREYRQLTPTVENRFALLPARTSRGYREWPSLTELALVPPYSGPAERRGMALIDGDREKLADRMRDYFSSMPDKELAERHPALMPKRKKRAGDGKGFDAVEARARLLKHFRFDDSRIVPFPCRPFDTQWAYLDNLRPLFKEPSPELQELAGIPGNAFLVVREPNERAASGLAAWFSPFVCDYDFFAGNSRQFPLYVDASLKGHKTGRRRHGARRIMVDPNPIPNLSQRSKDYLSAIEPPIRRHEAEIRASMLADGVDAAKCPRPENLDELLWHHALAVLFTPAYNRENPDALGKDWPRIPIPCWKRPQDIEYQLSTLRSWSNMGKRIACLLSMRPLDAGEWPTLSGVAVLAGAGGSAQLPENLRLADSWAVRAKINAVRPGKGEAKARKYSPKEEDELAGALSRYNLDDMDVEQGFGAKTVDVFLNRDVCWRDVPEAVWEFEIGGHKALRKWLSYRAGAVIQRDLTLAECGTFTEIARRIALLIVLGLRLDYLWPRLVDEAER